MPAFTKKNGQWAFLLVPLHPAQHFVMGALPWNKGRGQCRYIELPLGCVLTGLRPEFAITPTITEITTTTGTVCRSYKVPPFP